VVSDSTWRKTRRSENGATCVEIRGTLDAIRDSKNPAGPTLHGNLTALLHTIKTGNLDRR
jgi:hypothetical protein